MVDGYPFELQEGRNGLDGREMEEDGRMDDRKGGRGAKSDSLGLAGVGRY